MRLPNIAFAWGKIHDYWLALGLSVFACAVALGTLLAGVIWTPIPTAESGALATLMIIAAFAAFHAARRIGRLQAVPAHPTAGEKPEEVGSKEDPRPAAEPEVGS